MQVRKWGIHIQQVVQKIQKINEECWNLLNYQCLPFLPSGDLERSKSFEKAGGEVSDGSDTPGIMSWLLSKSEYAISINERLRIFDWQWTWDIVFRCPCRNANNNMAETHSKQQNWQNHVDTVGRPGGGRFGQNSLQFPSCLHLADTGQRSNWTLSNMCERIDFEQVTLN